MPSDAYNISIHCMESWRASTGNVDKETDNYTNTVEKRMIVLQISRRCFRWLAGGWCRSCDFYLVVVVLLFFSFYNPRSNIQHALTLFCTTEILYVPLRNRPFLPLAVSSGGSFLFLNGGFSNIAQRMFSRSVLGGCF